MTLSYLAEFLKASDTEDYILPGPYAWDLWVKYSF